MAKVTFKHTTHDVIKQLYVKRKTFRLLLLSQMITFGLLGFFFYKLASFGYFSLLTAFLKNLINSIV